MTEAEADQKRREIAQRIIIADRVRKGSASPSYAAQIETDWRKWLPAVGPNTFTKPFSDDHADLWDWYWQITKKRVKGEPLTDEDWAFLAIWSRGWGKSSNIEWAAITEGALVGKGYVLYVCGNQEQADKHVGSIRRRIESGAVSQYYPSLSNPRIGQHGNKDGWRQDFLQTESGWAIMPVGLLSGASRGSKVDDERVSLIVLDDIDDLNDSPALVKKKLNVIAGTILPAGDENTLILFGQNLIHRNSVMNQIYTRKVDILSQRKVSGPRKAFIDLEIEQRVTEDGPKNFITNGHSSWVGFNMVDAQKFLFNSGKERFLAEYQHDFSGIERGRVIPEYDEALHVIGWSDFAKVFSFPFIPAHWHRDIGLDVGFTKGHQTAATWIATSALNSRLPNMKFRYRGLVWTAPGVDEIAEDILDAMKPDGARGYDERPQVTHFWMSHEAESEQQTLIKKHRLPFKECDSKKTAGVAQWRHFLRCDKTIPHPFYPDEQIEVHTLVNGVKTTKTVWKLGCPSWFDVVDDDQVVTPRDDRGLIVHRRQTIDWQWKPTPLTDAGMIKDEPVKADEDTNDSTRMVTASWAGIATPLTKTEYRESLLPEAVRLETMGAQIQAGGIENFNELWLQRLDAIQEVKIKQKQPRRGGMLDQIRGGR